MSCEPVYHALHVCYELCAATARIRPRPALALSRATELLANSSVRSLPLRKWSSAEASANMRGAGRYRPSACDALARTRCGRFDRFGQIKRPLKAFCTYAVPQLFDQ